MENKNDKLLYVCYSLPQKDYLKNNGIRYEIGGKSVSTDCPFWVFVRTEKLDELLKSWSLGNKN